MPPRCEHPLARPALAIHGTPTAQVLDGHFVVATLASATNPGQPGLWFVDPGTGAVTPVQGLQCELRGACSCSAGQPLRRARRAFGAAARLPCDTSGGTIGALQFRIQ